jgi:uncharacterized protein (TIGR03435 family)
MRGTSSALLVGALGVCAARALFAQAPAPSFEIASVKPNASGLGAPMAVRPQNDRLTIVNVPGRKLVQMAFRLDVEQIEGAPSWLVNEHFDVTAKATAPFSPSNRWQDMLRTLLEERFRLRVRHAPKEVQGFALVVARADGRLGPSLRRAGASCAELSARSKDPEKDDPCGVRTTAMRAFLTGMMSMHGLELSALVGWARADLRRPIVDETGLTGAFDWDVKWTPQNFLGQSFNRERFPTIDPEGPAIGTAFEEQLGLKLEPRRIPLDVIVIEHVERPMAD